MELTERQQFIQEIWDEKNSKHKYAKCDRVRAGKGIILIDRGPFSPHEQVFKLVFFPKALHAEPFFQVYPTLLDREKEYDYPGSVGLLHVRVIAREKRMELKYILSNMINRRPMNRSLISRYEGFRNHLFGHAFGMAVRQGLTRVQFLVEMDEAKKKPFAEYRLNAFEKEAEKKGYTILPLNKSKFERDRKSYLVASLD